MTPETNKQVENMADEIQQHFFTKGATVSKADYDLVCTKLFSLVSSLIHTGVEAAKNEKQPDDPHSWQYQIGFEKARKQIITALQALILPQDNTRV